VDTSVWRPDPARAVETRAELGLDDETAMLLYAGRICAQKQPLVFLRTMLELERAGHRFLAVVAGDGPDFKGLEAAVAAHGLGARVRLLGEVTLTRVRELMQAADMVFLPSEHEGIALVLYEAMACGVCVVAADVGGQRELLTPECGMLIERFANPDEQARAYARAIAMLLGDSERRREFGRQGRARVTDGFDVGAMGERMTALLEEAVRLHRSEPRSPPGIGLARAWASAAVEAAREEGRGGAPALLAAGEPVMPAAASHLVDPYTAGALELGYFTLRAALLPWYRWATERAGLRWLVTWKNRAKRRAVQAGAVRVFERGGGAARPS
jgi:hypothetical protein